MEKTVLGRENSKLFIYFDYKYFKICQICITIKPKVKYTKIKSYKHKK